VIERMPNNAPTMLAEVTMNKALWTVQVLWGIFFSVTGFGTKSCVTTQPRGTKLSSKCLGFRGAAGPLHLLSASVSFLEASA
jgi:hypothetical protein